jgi:hypothetical protein
VRLSPRLRLFAPFAVAAAPGAAVVSSPGSNFPFLSAEAEVGASEEGRVLLLLSASEPVVGLDLSSFGVAVERRIRRIEGGDEGEEEDEDEGERARVVSLSPVAVAEKESTAASTATLWHAVLQLPRGYLGPVVVSLKTQGVSSRTPDAAAISAAPSAPLALRVVAAPLLRPTGFQLLL